MTKDKTRPEKNSALDKFTPPNAYDAASEQDKNGEPSHLSSQAADPAAFDASAQNALKKHDAKP